MVSKHAKCNAYMKWLEDRRTPLLCLTYTARNRLLIPRSDAMWLSVRLDGRSRIGESVRAIVAEASNFALPSAFANCRLVKWLRLVCSTIPNKLTRSAFSLVYVFSFRYRNSKEQVIAVSTLLKVIMRVSIFLLLIRLLQHFAQIANHC